MSLMDRFIGGISESMIGFLTYLLHTYSGILQGLVFLSMGLVFLSALLKIIRAYKCLLPIKAADIVNRNLFLSPNNEEPLCIAAAAFFMKTKYHYDQGIQHSQRPPDDYLRDAAFQYSDRYFKEQVLEPITMTANLLPPLGFIGTIIGMAVHFISSSGGINTHATASGVAVALYTTLLALSGFIIIEFLKKSAYALSQKRINEGLMAVADARQKEAEPEIENIRGFTRLNNGVSA